jgi:BASS family bile acid:Na+ symporter
MGKILVWLNKGIALWVIVFGMIAYLIPGSFEYFKNSINIFFSLAMFGIGLVITEQDYAGILRNPVKVLAGTICQFTIMPLLALVTSRLFNLSDAWTLGLIITGAAPGAMTSNVISYLSKGDVAYSVSLTAVSTLLCPILTPLITLLLAGTRVPISFFPMFKTILLVVGFPLIAGFLVRKNAPALVSRLRELPPTLSVVAIVVITSYVIAVNRENLGLASLLVIAAVAFHNASGMAMGFFAGYLMKLDFLSRKTLCIEIGMQNAGLGVILALQFFGKEVAIPAAIFTVWCIITASLLVYFWNYIETRQSTGIPGAKD